MGKKLREDIEIFEETYLSSFAQLSKNTKGRCFEEEECDVRSPYQRDRDRIIHCESFRKLKGKTQVFIVQNDNFRTRLTHTLEVSQIARTIARALRLNEDLVEAIALGHDLGHTCFGHSGEEVLDKITGCFKHNEQSLRIVEKLERDGKGLNLTFEVRDGILNHTGEGIPVTMEGKLVKLVDRITYLCHDIQDSIQAGILKQEDIPKDIIEVLGHAHSGRVNVFVKDIIEETSKQILSGNPPNIYQTATLEETMMQLRFFMFETVYNGDLCLREKEKATYIVEFLFHYFMENPEKIHAIHGRTICKEGLQRSIVDYIANCTDHDAIKLFQTMVIPSPKYF
ncbi:deoxyguanosinetriphosphate triphosphohydrolase [Clostridium formicaceticum]|uniref:Deoxyguanosinetriphosphate triphosphohydrolase n=1 Tax=Clostridium formicaceticum TaxID=1497 RepID=A0AAC9RM37_9CLOT|nr:deoxyguanosinetriphosphate triphosphohydrolase [Clostridium formicaceticum]AOY77526.1 deoxyguanosinetriphosphate triphosphohydrolase [Clostridium formicaceticum]ARE88097.1 Deoxyguanosinetriphosphate triphosphohydrolase [Clostridium formicaceticum]